MIFTKPRRRLRCVLVVVFCVVSIGAIGQGVSDEKQTILPCYKGTFGTQPVKHVRVTEFNRSGCRPTLEYFQALDALPRLQYAQVRKGLAWTLNKTSKGGLQTGEEAFEIIPGINLTRRYKASDVTVIVQNATDVPIFIEGHDIMENQCPECEVGAYIAVGPHSKRAMYQIQAMVANQVWQPARMHIALLKGQTIPGGSSPASLSQSGH
jgi:hypothetical protein